MEKQTRRPLIGITRGTSEKSLKTPHLYVRAVKRAGGTAELLSPDVDVLKAAEQYDGMIISGGKDINPSFYNEKVEIAIHPEEETRINFEISLLREIINEEKPVFGICYGMQLINVFCKGTLYQDIELQVPGSRRHRKGVHTIRIETNPYIIKGDYTVETSHHQAIKHTGVGLIPFARAEDGIIEAIYKPDYLFLLGVQWHPERATDTLSHVLFKRFIEACRGN